MTPTSLFVTINVVGVCAFFVYFFAHIADVTATHSTERKSIFFFAHGH